ncbi:MAG TPA: AAA family ATPase [Saprospiraceae bacterium]|nr:AAA family ATPase [Saprospiraceae bacterium]
MNLKIKEAQLILNDLGLPIAQQNKVSALTLLALCGIKPQDNWQEATANNLTLSKDIIEFVNKYYDAGYKPNSRESFRKIALKPFVKFNIALLNPEDTTLSPTSSKTHYSLSKITLDTIKQFGSINWPNAVKEFIKNQYLDNISENILLKSIHIKNYKSIYDDSIELGRFNVFIGINGSGKSNILESLATASAAIANDLTYEGLYNRGVRIAKPNLLTSSFLKNPKIKTIDISLKYLNDNALEDYEMSLNPENENDIFSKWIDQNHPIRSDEEKTDYIIKELDKYRKLNEAKTENELIDFVKKLLNSDPTLVQNNTFIDSISDFAIYNINTKSLRGINPTDSRKTPLGINGEGLDILISNFNSYENSFLLNCYFLFDWLKSIYTDTKDKEIKSDPNISNHSSSLYFIDKYMQKQNNTFSAANSNEGILHILFYIALFISNKTPSIFAIDNIESTLNPRLCQKLMPILVGLAKERGKQALIATHNPAILDGLNLLDDEQRLFEVYRDSGGKTKTRRIKFRSNLEDKHAKLSEMWLNGLLGAVPNNF